LKDIPVIIAGLALFYGLISLSRYWAGEVNIQTVIQLYPSALPKYALFSVARLAAAYAVSLAVTLVYCVCRRAQCQGRANPDTASGYAAIDPGLELCGTWSHLVDFHGAGLEYDFQRLFFDQECAREMLEAAQVYRLSWWQKFVQLELPYAAIGLVWNSMMSVAGGWFFLMACEMFVLGNRDPRLPGLGSYLQTASNAGDTRAIVWGVFTMIAVIVLMDQVIWRPIIAWSEKFKFEQVEASEVPRSPILHLLRHSRVAAYAGKAVAAPLYEALSLHFARRNALPPSGHTKRQWSKWAARALTVLILLGIMYAVVKMSLMVAMLSAAELREILWAAGATFLRVEFVLILAALWTVPVGIYMGLRPGLSAIAQPNAQIAASVPATALFPIVLLALIRVGGGLGVGSIVLLLLGTQWYILFNVIAGASAIPSDLKEVCDVFRLSAVERWCKLLLPGIFPYLITGLVTASGGAWNASIVAEYFHFHGQTITTTGLGAVISGAADRGNFPALLTATIVMASIVVTINRLIWRRLYALASGRFSLNG
jgi:NitT/TauT family transport system permease protein